MPMDSDDDVTKSPSFKSTIVKSHTCVTGRCGTIDHGVCSLQYRKPIGSSSDHHDHASAATAQVFTLSLSTFSLSTCGNALFLLAQKGLVCKGQTATINLLFPSVTHGRCRCRWCDMTAGECSDFVVVRAQELLESSRPFGHIADRHFRDEMPTSTRSKLASIGLCI